MPTIATAFFCMLLEAFTLSDVVLGYSRGLGTICLGVSDKRGPLAAPLKRYNPFSQLNACKMGPLLFGNPHVEMMGFQRAGLFGVFAVSAAGSGTARPRG